MTYQFDPRPQGLHYQPFTAACCTQTMWYLRDGAPEPWIDLRSIFEALGMSWARKWNMYCLAKIKLWQLAVCCDIKRRETLLAPASKMPAILGEVYGLCLSHHSAARRIRELHLIWRDKFKEIQAGDAVVKSPAAIKVKKRKVNAYIVRQIYQLQKKGHTKTAIARALQVSLATIQQVAAGTYRSMDAETLAAWHDTFGAPKA